MEYIVEILDIKQSIAEQATDGQEGPLGSRLLPNKLLCLPGCGSGSAGWFHPCLLTEATGGEQKPHPRNTSTCIYKEGAPHRKAGHCNSPPQKFQVPFCTVCQPELPASLCQESSAACWRSSQACEPPLGNRKPGREGRTASHCDLSRISSTWQVSFCLI